MKPASEPLRAISDVPARGLVRIASIEGCHEERIRLMSMGLRKGLEVKVMRNSGSGPIVVAYGTSRMALGRAMAGKIKVA